MKLIPAVVLFFATTGIRNDTSDIVLRLCFCFIAFALKCRVCQSAGVCAGNNDYGVSMNCSGSCFKFEADDSGTKLIRNCFPQHFDSSCQPESYQGASGTGCYCNTDNCNGSASLSLMTFLIFLPFFNTF